MEELTFFVNKQTNNKTKQVFLVSFIVIFKFYLKNSIDKTISLEFYDNQRTYLIQKLRILQKQHLYVSAILWFGIFF